MSLKKELEGELNMPVRVRTGGLGALDVYADGEQIFSKKRSGRLPRAGELAQLIRTKQAGV